MQWGGAAGPWRGWAEVGVAMDKLKHDTSCSLSITLAALCDGQASANAPAPHRPLWQCIASLSALLLTLAHLLVQVTDLARLAPQSGAFVSPEEHGAGCQRVHPGQSAPPLRNVRRTKAKAGGRDNVTHF